VIVGYNGKSFMVATYNPKIKGSPFTGSHRLPLAMELLVLCRPDPETIARIKPEHY